MRLLTWNLNARVGTLGSQAERVAFSNADVVCLQEVTLASAGRWREWFAGRGFGVRDTVDCVGRGRRRYAVMIASRAGFEDPPPMPIGAPWPERVLGVSARTPIGVVEVHTVHLPAGASDRADGSHAKSETFEAIAARLSVESSTPRVLCGDFNSPKEERPDGAMLCFGGRWDSEGRAVARRSERSRRQWAAEESVMRGLAAAGWIDTYRALHPGNDAAGHSFRQRRAGKEWRRRFDHAFVDGVRPKMAAFDLDVLDRGLSDHAALVIELGR